MKFAWYLVLLLFFVVAVGAFGAEAAADAAAKEADKTPWYMVLLTALGVLSVPLLPFLLGHRIANALRMKDYGWKIGLILATVTSGIVVLVMGWPPKLGIDLSSGVILVYEIDPQASQQMQEDDEKQDKQNGQNAKGTGITVSELVPTLKQRIDPTGVKEIVVRPYGPRQVEIIIPKMSEGDVDEIKEKIVTAGHLRFRILADEQKDAIICARADHASQADSRIVKDRSGEPVAEWIKIDRNEQGEYALEPAELGGHKTRTDPRTGEIEILVLIDPYNFEGRHLSRAWAGYDNQMQNCIHFTMTNRGSVRFGHLTGTNLPDKQTGFYRKLGIIMDNELLSAPRIMSRISDRGQITGRFTQKEVEFLAGILKAGRLPAALRSEPISENRVSPMLGEDTIAKGQWAIVFSLAAVILFMLVYYRFSGVVACLALATNLILILAFMILFKAALTLPGLAGLVLTVGMSVDANVLIFERIREELARGAALRMALRNGFSRATTTIVDANVTTLITAIVLYAIGTDQVRGFAVTLILGILMSMFTAIFCSRVLFDIAERKRWIKDLSMMRMLGHTDIDFIGKRRIAAVCSGVLIIIGITATVWRGTDIFDIDFSGGTSVQVLFKSAIPIEQVRGLVREKLPKDWDVWVTGVDISGKEDRVYKIDTSVTGFGDIGKIEITDRSGKSMTVDLSRAATRDDIVNAVNKAARASGVAVLAKANFEWNGVEISDVSRADAGNFIVASADDGLNTAEKLNVAHNGPELSVDSGALPGSVNVVQKVLLECLTENDVSLLAMHKMEFGPPTLLAMAQDDVGAQPAVPAGVGETEPPAAGDADAAEPPESDAAEPGDSGAAAPGHAEPTDDGEPVDANRTQPSGAGGTEPAKTGGAEPTATDDARSDLPEDTVLAFAGDHVALLASAGEDASGGEPSANADAAAETASDAEAATTEKAEAEASSAADDATAAGEEATTEEQPGAEPESAESASSDESKGETEPESADPQESATTDNSAESAGDDSGEPGDTSKEGTNDTPAGETPAADDTEKPVEAAPEDTTTSETQPATEPKPTDADDSSAAGPPAKGQPADDEAAVPDSGAEPLAPTADGTSAEDEPEQPQQTIYLCDSNLQFDEPISAESVISKIKSAAKKLEISEPQMRLEGENASTEPLSFTPVPDAPGVYSSNVSWPMRWAMAGDENLHDFRDLASLKTLTGGAELAPPPEGTDQGFAWENGTLYVRLADNADPNNANIQISPNETDLAARWDGESSKGFTRWNVKFTTDPQQTTALLGMIRDDLASSPVWPSSNKIGAAVAGKMKQMAVAALLASLLGIVGYIWFRFQKVVYGLAAVVALVHDVAITLGAIAVSAWLANYLGFLMIDNFKISLPVVAAFLTIIGYSLNDTIVVFDRIREVKGKSPDLTASMVNTSINQTLSRTLLTSITTLLVVVILFFLGGQGIHSFAFCLLVGVLVGTYSSIFVASPFLLWMTGAAKSPARQAAE